MKKKDNPEMTLEDKKQISHDVSKIYIFLTGVNFGIKFQGGNDLIPDLDKLYEMIQQYNEYILNDKSNKP